MKDKHQNISFNLIPYALLTALTILVCWLFAGRHGVFASSVDWISQHSVFPGYFRRQFYETGELFPEFAASLGGGQNIYNFSYYGLLSPVVLLSYLFPFVKMSDYLMAASIISLAASVLLLYHWLRSRSFSREICLAVSILFLLAGPMVFQSCRHIMFVNYMPFLCLALSGMDRYVETGRPGLYITAVFLMILTSFYFSIGGIFVLLVYGASRCKKISIASTAGLVLPAAAAVLASGILLVPTAYALLSGRGSSQSFSLADPGDFRHPAYGDFLQKQTGAASVRLLPFGSYPPLFLMASKRRAVYTGKIPDSLSAPFMLPCRPVAGKAKAGKHPPLGRPGGTRPGDCRMLPVPVHAQKRDGGRPAPPAFCPGNVCASMFPPLQKIREDTPSPAPLHGLSDPAWK